MRSIVLSGHSGCARGGEAEILLRDDDAAPGRAEQQVARQLAVAGEGPGDARAHPADREDRDVARSRQQLEARHDARPRTFALEASLVGLVALHLDRLAAPALAVAGELPQRVEERGGVGRGGAMHLHRQIVDRPVEQVVARPHVVAAHDRVEAVDGDDLGVRPGEGAAFRLAGTAAHRRDVHRDARALDVADVAHQLPRAAARVGLQRRVLAHHHAHDDAPVAARQRGDGVAHGARNARRVSIAGSRYRRAIARRRSSGRCDRRRHRSGRSRRVCRHGPARRRAWRAGGTRRRRRNPRRSCTTAGRCRAGNPGSRSGRPADRRRACPSGSASGSASPVRARCGATAHRSRRGGGARDRSSAARRRAGRAAAWTTRDRAAARPAGG